jgi:hypothetical protein
MTDNTMVPLSLASGETVTVDRKGSGGGSQVGTVMLNMKPGRYSKEEVRGIFDVARDLFADGYKIQMV